VFSIALRFTGRHADAEEVAQDMFLQLHGALAQIASAAHLMPLRRAGGSERNRRMRGESGRGDSHLQHIGYFKSEETGKIRIFDLGTHFRGVG
jgi:hypothetical protein